MSSDDVSSSGTDRIELKPDGCEMPECTNTEGLKTCSDPENNLLEMCAECRSAWPVEVVCDPLRTQYTETEQ